MSFYCRNSGYSISIMIMFLNLKLVQLPCPKLIPVMPVAPASRNDSARPSHWQPEAQPEPEAANGLQAPGQPDPRLM